MSSNKLPVQTVFILSISSDIGRALAGRYLRDGCTVVGTYRRIDILEDLMGQPGLYLFPCDVKDPGSVKSVIEKYHRLSLPWGMFISCVGTLEPIGDFFSTEFDAWERSVIINSTAQLRVLHALYPYRRKGQVSHAVFFAGGGTNNPFPNYSAYCVSKIMLMKMCELLDNECSDLNAFIVGPGWTRTKMHKQTINNAENAGMNYKRTREFMEAGGNNGTSMDDIYDCIQWLAKQGKTIAGGRNFSVRHDHWRGEEAYNLTQSLVSDPDLFKLRRYRHP
ncbi:MAG: SDR family oxidoreductase [Bacillota bacterium]